jgi:hypothetical protein
MMASSIRFTAVAALTLASFHSAIAGAAIIAPRPHFAPPPRLPMANRMIHPQTASQSRPFDFGDFRHDRRRSALLFPFGSSFAIGPDAVDDGAPAADVIPALAAPGVNVSITFAAPAYAPYPQAGAFVGGPKIITIGAARHSAHFAKMPIVIYGGQPSAGHIKAL